MKNINKNNVNKKQEHKHTKNKIHLMTPLLPQQDIMNENVDTQVPKDDTPLYTYRPSGSQARLSWVQDSLHVSTVLHLGCVFTSCIRQEK